MIMNGIRLIFRCFVLTILLFVASHPARSQTLLVDSLASGPVWDSVIGPDTLVSIRFWNLKSLDVHQASGRLALAWSQPDTLGYNDVWCAIYDKDFVMIDTAFRVNKTATGDQIHAFVKFNQNNSAGDDLVFAWAGTGQGTTYDIYLKKIDASTGTPSDATSDTDVIAVDTSVFTGRQNMPMLAIDYSRNEVITAWRAPDGNDGDGHAAYARRFDLTTLQALDTAFIINNVTTSHQVLSEIAYSPVTDELLTLCQSKGYSPTSTIYRVIFRPFTRDGNDNFVGGTEVTVNNNTSYQHWNGRITLHPSSGDYMISWTATNLDGSGEGCYARVFDKDHTELQAQFRVNVATQDNQLTAVPMWDETSGKVVFFYYWSSSSQQTIRYQHFDADFNTVGSEMEALLDPNDSSSVIRTYRYKGYFSGEFDQVNRKAYLAYNVYNSSSGPKSIGYVRRFSYQTNFNKNWYARLKSRLDGGFHSSIAGKLYFSYDERYSVDAGDTLNYRIMDKGFDDVTPSTVLTKGYGVNWYALDLNGVLTDGEYYVLEVRNDKGDLELIRFRHEE